MKKMFYQGLSGFYAFWIEQWGAILAVTLIVGFLSGAVAFLAGFPAVPVAAGGAILGAAGMLCLFFVSLGRLRASEQAVVNAAGRYVAESASAAEAAARQRAVRKVGAAGVGKQVLAAMGAVIAAPVAGAVLSEGEDDELLSDKRNEAAIPVYVDGGVIWSGGALDGFYQPQED